MPRYVALLRGINVGRAKRIAMADLRALLGDLGYSDVRTHLNSGNAVFTGAEADPAEHAARIATGLLDRLGLDVRCVVLTADELRAIVDGHPLPEIASNGSRMLANVLAAPLDPALLAAHDPIALDPQNARLGSRVIYQWCPDGVLQAPPVGEFVEKHLGVAVTARNWNTISKLAEFL
ncbi:DUF1697 domain-containing protein [Pseudonocardia nigra]|uniref:DUF1697 domain-containing protein n=1 Tax=Pseudonocardia nigra TaxID=1921578 RepID=UPI001C5F1629|nr:DUF1697 domain-containing protein [Pseudonocardia nigra]